MTDLRLAVNRSWIGQGRRAEGRSPLHRRHRLGPPGRDLLPVPQEGRGVHVEGSLKMETWDDKTTGEKRTKIKVQADRVQFLDRREDGPGGGPAGRRRLRPGRGRRRRGPAPARRPPRRRPPGRRQRLRRRRTAPRRPARPPPPATPTAKTKTSRSDPIRPRRAMHPDRSPSTRAGRRRLGFDLATPAARSSWIMAKMTDKKPAKAKAKAKATTKKKAAPKAGGSVGERPSRRSPRRRSASRASSGGGTTRCGPRTATCRSS